MTNAQANRTHRGLASCLSLASLGIALIAGSANGFILPRATHAQKQRRDIGKQWVKLVDCFAKATYKCEKDGGHSGLECYIHGLASLPIPTADPIAEPPADPKGKFSGAVAKCLAKVDFDKKGSGDGLFDFAAMGCPRFTQLNPDQSVAGMALAAELAASVLVEGTNAIAAAGCPYDSESTERDAIDCAQDEMKRFRKYVKGYLKCQQLCENDYKNKKGDGGGNDDGRCGVTLDPAPAFSACVAKALAKATKKTPLPDPALLSLIQNQLDSEGTLFYDGAGCD